MPQLLGHSSADKRGKKASKPKSTSQTANRRRFYRIWAVPQKPGAVSLSQCRRRRLELEDLLDDGDRQVGSRIKALRKEAELSQLELAEKLTISQAELSKLESGSKILSMSRAKSIAEILKNSVEYVLTGKADKSIENQTHHKRSKAG